MGRPPGGPRGGHLLRSRRRSRACSCSAVACARRDGAALGVILAFAWAAYPFTDYALQSNSNDTLVAALLVWALVVFAAPVWRGVLLALSVATKFAPLPLLPLFAAGDAGFGAEPRARSQGRAGRRGAALFLLAFAFGVG